MTKTAYSAPQIFDGERAHQSSAVLVEHGVIVAIVPLADVPQDAMRIEFLTGILSSGFVDLQVNGGGGRMLNDDPSLEAIKVICAAHRPFGSMSLLPTLITDTPQITARAVAVAIEAQDAKVQGFVGLHLEGPHLSLARQGAHDPKLIRPMSEEDLRALLNAKQELTTLLTTVAPESVTPDQIRAMANEGIIVSLGHSDCDYKTAMSCFEAGASMVTHLFNAMSQMGNREPGLVGAALESGLVSAGIIADGFHVHTASLRAALKAKAKPGSLFLVTDAMSTVGSDIASFELNGRTILRYGGRLTLADGTLAGADIDMISTVRFAAQNLGLTTFEALAMATSTPARAIGQEQSIGTLRVGARADLLHLSNKLEISQIVDAVN
jgi:N-acetylglucosamine-6-phosphate deacetylase